MIALRCHCDQQKKLQCYTAMAAIVSQLQVCTVVSQRRCPNAESDWPRWLAATVTFRI
jgi:lipoate synthase